MAKEKPIGWVRLQPVLSQHEAGSQQGNTPTQVKWCRLCSLRGVKCRGGPRCISQKGKKKAVANTKPAGAQEPSQDVQALTCINAEDCFWMSCMSYVQSHQLSKKYPILDANIMVPYMQTSEPLKYAALAIGAVHANRQGSIDKMVHNYPYSATPAGLYRKSLLALQTSLGQGGDIIRRDDLVTTTFLLSIFEVISESPTEDGWVRHLLHGTGKMVELAGPSPDQPISYVRLTLLQEFRIFEVGRAIMYEKETILSQRVWEDFFRGLGTGIPEPWDPLSTILTIITRVSSFHIRLVKLVESVPPAERRGLLFLDALRIRGLELQKELYAWREEAARREPSIEGNVHMQLGICYYHALLVYLSDGFKRYDHWKKAPTPRLSLRETHSHSTAILPLIKRIYHKPLALGVLLQFPLKISAMHASSDKQKQTILGILDQLYQKGFTASSPLKRDLLARWQPSEAAPS